MSNDGSAIVDIVWRAVKTVGGQEFLPSGTGEDHNLFDLGIDSLKLLEFVSVLEEQLGIEFPNAILSAKNFANVGAVVKAIESILGGRG